MRHTPDALMLFAAGFGTRMGPLTAQRPKPLVQVAGRALLDHALDLVEQAGMARKVANIHYLGEQVVDHLAGRGVDISDERDRVLETGGGLRKALPLLGDGPVFTLNTDAIWTGPNPLTGLRAAWDGAQMSALLMLVPPERAQGHTGTGDFTLAPDGRLTRGKGHVYTGAQIIDPTGLHDITHDVFSLNLLWDQLLAQGRVYGVVHRGGWCDVGRPDSIALAETLLKDTP
ncbi:nucleotidyltransferase [Thioclava sp. SK-1]|uniref:nucleotidyltransferase family protein n=1 Tax=Thioclava sp. SK-1 TaxID=1889770 RepID=UPI00082699D7|nr:nucleotidyltransferase family protein [Thioclava sp. SK-1]OCX61577.1 nucleotidyltransferase [Thioclava sp. SK-1]